MNEKPFFSVIIPALNEAKYLPKLLGDLSKQTFKDFEVIVVDGKSEDKTVELTKNYSDKLPKLTILTSDRRHVCTQRNLGAKHAIGEVLIFSDADNRIDQSFLLGLKYRWDTTKSDILATWTKSDIDNPQNKVIAAAINLFLETQSNIKPYFLLEALFAISKKCFNAIGGFDETIMYSEGKNIIKKAHGLGFVYKIVRDPVYTYSYRRFRHNGTLKLISHVAKIEISSFLGIDDNKKYAKYYPMLGGAVFTKTKQEKSKFLKKIEKFLKKLESF